MSSGPALWRLGPSHPVANTGGTATWAPRAEPFPPMTAAFLLAYPLPHCPGLWPLILLHFSLKMPTAPSPEARSCCLDLLATCPIRAGPGVPSKPGAGPLTVTSRSPLVMDSSSTRNCRSSTFLRRERGLSGLCPGRWASPSQQWQTGEATDAQTLSQWSRHLPEATWLTEQSLLQTSSPPNHLICAPRRNWELHSQLSTGSV